MSALTKQLRSSSSQPFGRVAKFAIQSLMSVSIRYHINWTGLWFNPIQDCLFDSTIGACVNQKDHVSANPDSNLVYEPATKRLYERCLSVCCHPNETGVARWSLPATLNSGRPRDSIRRVKPDELPPLMAGPYSSLLIEWLQQQVPIKQVRHQSSESSLSPMLTQQKQQLHNCNPLVLTKRDFDNQYVWDIWSKSLRDAV